jgi:hypothetical protein
MAATLRRDRGRPVPSTPRRVYWQAQLEAQRRSGLTAAVFCARRSLHPGTFSFWKWKLARDSDPERRRAAKRSGPRPTFIPIQLASARAAHTGTVPATARDERSEIEITLDGRRGVRVRGRVDVGWLGHLLRVVDALGC